MFKSCIIKTYKHTEQGTELRLLIPGQHIGQEIKRYARGGKIQGEINIPDYRAITPEQRKKAYATVKDIALWSGHHPEYLKELLKYDFMIKTGHDYFSLSNCSITRAKDYINHLIDFAIENYIPLSDLAINRVEDIDRYLYSCLKHRRCCITGVANADIHHVTGSRVGMGNNRKTINHSGRQLIALNREWHNKVHMQGEEEIFKKYKVYGIAIDANTLNKLGLKAEDIN